MGGASLSAQEEPPTDVARLTAPVRGWAAYALVAAAGTLLLAAVVGLVPDRSIPFTLHAAGRFDTFVNLATMGFPVAAVYLAHRSPALRGGRLVTVVALAELATAAVGGTVFGAMIGLYGLVNHGPGVSAGVLALLTWLAYLGLLVVAIQYCWRVWRGRYAGTPGRASAAGAERTTFLPGAAGPPAAEVPTMRTPAVRPTGGLYGQRQPHPPSPAQPPWHASHPVPEASPDVAAVLAGAHPAQPPAAAAAGPAPTAAPPPVESPPPVWAPTGSLPTLAGSAGAAPPAPAPPTGSAPSAPAAPITAAAPTAPPAPRPGDAAVPGCPPPGRDAGDTDDDGDAGAGRTPAPEATQVLAGPPGGQPLAGPQGTQILPSVSRAGPETTHLLPPHER